jgi:threonine synthase
VAGLLKRQDAGLLDPDQLVVATVTGNGLKDTETALSGLEIATETCRPDVSAAAAALGL